MAPPGRRRAAEVHPFELGIALYERRSGVLSRGVAVAAFLAAKLNGFRILVPAMKAREVARVPSLAEPRSPQIPVGADLARHGPQVVPEVGD